MMFFPSIQPSLLISRRNASTTTALPEAVLLSRKPIRGTLPACCASEDAQNAENNAVSAKQMTVFLIGFLRVCALCYLITLSALASTLGGIVKPICLVVFRLITNSNFIGCSTARSAGFVPFRILSTYTAARRKFSASLAE